ncbi:hypothetical protein FHR54_000318 [Xanthomonas arboricola]
MLQELDQRKMAALWLMSALMNLLHSGKPDVSC